MESYNLHINLPYSIATITKDKDSEAITVIREVTNWSHPKVHYVAGSFYDDGLQNHIESSYFKKLHNLPF